MGTGIDMDAATVNMNILALRAKYKVVRELPLAAYEEEMKEMDEEFLKLYKADNKFEKMSKENIRFMFRYNILRRVEPFHMFGIFIEI